MSIHRYAVALLVALGGLVMPASPAAPAAALSCVGPHRVLTEAPVVYTGTIVDAADGRIRVAVDEVWRGHGIPAHPWLEVDLAGWTGWAGPDGEVADGFSSSDRWVFAPHRGTINPCTAWRFDDDHADLARHRPEDPVEPGNLDQAVQPDESTEGSSSAPEDPGGRVAWWPWWVGGVSIVVLVGLGVLLGRRRT